MMRKKIITISINMPDDKGRVNKDRVIFDLANQATFELTGLQSNEQQDSILVSIPESVSASTSKSISSLIPELVPTPSLISRPTPELVSEPR